MAPLRDNRKLTDGWAGIAGQISAHIKDLDDLSRRLDVQAIN